MYPPPLSLVQIRRGGRGAMSIASELLNLKGKPEGGGALLVSPGF